MAGGTESLLANESEKDAYHQQWLDFTLGTVFHFPLLYVCYHTLPYTKTKENTKLYQ